jgi:hypothetical protein
VRDTIDIGIGDDVYTLSHGDARWLVERLHETYDSTEGSEEVPAFALAWGLELALEEGGYPDRITLGVDHVVPVLRIVKAAEQPSAELVAVQDALLRLQLDED